jgi:hypothetical protein
MSVTTAEIWLDAPPVAQAVAWAWQSGGEEAAGALAAADDVASGELAAAGDAWWLPPAALAMLDTTISPATPPSTVSTLCRRGHDLRGGRPCDPGGGHG